MDSKLMALQAPLGQGSLTCDLSDASDAVAVLPMVFAWRSNETPFLGPAHTVAAPSGDLDAVFEGIRTAKPGCVIVIETGRSDRAIWGENATRGALAMGVAGIILDGACRDVKAVRLSGLSVVGRGVSPQRAERTGKGKVGETLQLHGVTIHPGDLIIGDENGTAVVPSAQVDHLVKTISSTNQEIDNETNR
jgi:4-hydroxy-4-methyl-2-oxoglutarate aldolase